MSEIARCRDVASPALTPADKDKQRQAVHDAARQFEGYLLGEMFKLMRGGEGAGQGILPPSRAERIFVRQQCEALGELMAARGPLGVARMVERQHEQRMLACQPGESPGQVAGGPYEQD